MIEHALHLIDLGYKVFPLHTPQATGGCSCHKDCGRDNGKHPRTISGLKDASTEPDRIKTWWENWSDANIGLVTGAISNCVVIDIDPRHEGDKTFKALLLQHGELAEKVWASTGGGGWHLYFRHPEFHVKSASRALGGGVDVKGDGGYVVAPPSLHASGKRYEWHTPLSRQLPELPAWLKTLLYQPAQISVGVTRSEHGIQEGGRNQYLTSLGGSMRRRGISEDGIYAALCVENETNCQPPLADAEVRKIAHSVARYNVDDPVFVFPARVERDGERPEGVYFVSEFSDKIRTLYQTGIQGGVSTGISKLDSFYKIKLGQLTVVTGVPSHGKTAWLDCILHNLADLHDWRIAVTSIENQPLERHAAQLLSIHTNKPFGKGNVPRMTESDLEESLEWLQEHFVFVLPNEGGCTVSGILDCVDWVDSTDFSLQGIVIDPWNELEHKRPPNMNETEYVSQSLGRMRRFARAKEKHLWLVAHPTKLHRDMKTGDYPVPTLYDVSGSSHFRNKADMGVSVWRDVLNEKSPTEIHIQKVRFRECGKVGKCELFFDIVSGRFLEDAPNYFPSESEDEGSVKW